LPLWNQTHKIGKDTPQNVGTKGRAPLSFTTRPPATPTAGAPVVGALDYLLEAGGLDLKISRTFS
jgi:hypothetical protein